MRAVGRSGTREQGGVVATREEARDLGGEELASARRISKVEWLN